MGWCVDDDPVTGNKMNGNKLVYQANLGFRLLGHTPDLSEFKNRVLGVIKLSWLRNWFGALPDRDDREIMKQYVRARILTLLSIYFSNKKQGCVKLMWLPLLENLTKCGNLSWGQGLGHIIQRYMLSCQSRCKRNSGGLQLLQIWVWVRFTQICSVIDRSQL